MKRALVVGPDWLGDVLFCTPALRALKKSAPELFITFTTSSRCGDVLAGNPYVDETLVFDELPWPRGAAANFYFAREIKQRDFDTAILIHGSATRAFLTFSGGIPERVGFSTPKRRRMLSLALEKPVIQSHRSELYFEPFKALGVLSDGFETDYFLRDEDEHELEKSLRGTGLETKDSFAVIHAGANWPLKRWPAPFFSQVVGYLNRKGLRCALIGGAPDRPIVNEIIERSQAGSAISLAGRTTIRVLGALLGRARLIVSNDSGPLHVAAGLGTPLVGLYGPTLPEVTGPRSRGPARVLRHRVGCELACTFASCHSRICMERLTPEHVFLEIESVMKDETAGSRIH